MSSIVRVSPTLLSEHALRSELVQRAVSVLEGDLEVAALLKMANVMAVSRLGYNDHGPIHAKIVAGSALELLERLIAAGVKPSSLVNKTAKSIDEVKVLVVLAAYLHDIGNSIHRDMHEKLSALLAKDIIDRILLKVLEGVGNRLVLLRCEAMHAIYATAYDVQCLTVEAGVIKIADGLDMSEGRARVPYEKGKIDMHSVSALSIKEVCVGRGEKRPIRITVKSDDTAGLFQIENILLPKIRTSGLENYIETALYSQDRILVNYPH
ncbi:MAG: HD domain-containing protein [Thermofilaceae archaeon]